MSLEDDIIKRQLRAQLEKALLAIVAGTKKPKALADGVAFNTGDTLNGKEIWGVYYEFTSQSLAGGTTICPGTIPSNFDKLVNVDYTQEQSEAIITPRFWGGPYVADAVTFSFGALYIVNDLPTVGFAPVGTIHRLTLYYTPLPLS